MTASPILVTGSAGFVGFHLVRRLLADGERVVGIDDLNAYYDPRLKERRLEEIGRPTGFEQHRLDLADGPAVLDLVGRIRPTRVVHLAAQAGVRHSIQHPWPYLRSNVDGFLSVLEGCRSVPVEHLVYASSSSVYGANRKIPFSEDDPVDSPVSIYAATKRSNELMAETYSRLHGLAATGLRLFTVYGPWGRPDMAYWSFTRAVFEGREIELFNEGRMSRDFTYVDDAVEAIVRVLRTAPRAEGERPAHAIYNVGNHAPVELERFVQVIAEAAGRPARTVLRPMPPGDLPRTAADIRRLAALVGFSPSTPIETGIGHFVRWYREHHGISG